MNHPVVVWRVVHGQVVVEDREEVEVESSSPVPNERRRACQQGNGSQGGARVHARWLGRPTAHHAEAAHLAALYGSLFTLMLLAGRRRARFSAPE